MPKITPKEKKDREEVRVKTKVGGSAAKPGAWWNAASKKDLAAQLIATADILKQQNQQRYRQTALHMRLYGNLPMFGWLGTNLSRISTKNQLPSDRPTMSVITSITDTITSRLSQSNPRPFFLTDAGDYKQRQLAEQMNTFISGELYQTKAYELGELILRDGCVTGTGATKIVETLDKRVGLERRLGAQILVDSNEAFLGDPRQYYEPMLVDRAIAAEMFPDKAAMIMDRAEQAFPDSSGSDTVSDQIIIIEAWRLPSSKTSGDGMRAIACSAGLLFDGEWKRSRPPFVFMHYSPPMVGFWGQGIAERQMGNQNAINRLLQTIHKSINLVGVPRVFLEDGSKVVKAQINNDVGSIVTYRGTMPTIVPPANCNSPELFQECNNVIERAYREEGVSELAASGKKPAGLNSGEAQREYDDIQSDRWAALQKRYQNFFVDLSYQIIDQAREIAERDGKYQSVYPDKDGTKQIDLPASKLLDDPFVIQCFEVSSLPRDPAGRIQRVTEWVQAGMYTPQEGRRLMGLPDTKQEDRLQNAGEERILKYLDEIVETGKYNPPDPFMDPDLALQKVVQYINLYGAQKLEEEKMQKLRDWFTQVNTLKAAAMPPAMPQAGMTPQAQPMPAPQSQLIPNVPGA